MVKCRLQRGAFGRLLLQKVGVVLHKAGDRPADEVQIGVHRAVRSLQGTRNFVDRPPAPHREVERHSCAQHDSRKQQQNHLNQQRVQPLHRLLFRQNEQITQAQRVTARKVQDQIVAAVPCALRGQPVFGQAVGQIQVIVAVQADPAVVIVQHKQRIAVVLLQKRELFLQPVRIDAEEHGPGLAAHRAAAGDAVIDVLPAQLAEKRRAVVVGANLLPQGGVVAPLPQVVAEDLRRVDRAAVDDAVHAV